MASLCRDFARIFTKENTVLKHLKHFFNFYRADAGIYSSHLAYILSLIVSTTKVVYTNVKRSSQTYTDFLFQNCYILIQSNVQYALKYAFLASQLIQQLVSRRFLDIKVFTFPYTHASAIYHIGSLDDRAVQTTNCTMYKFLKHHHYSIMVTQNL